MYSSRAHGNIIFSAIKKKDVILCSWFQLVSFQRWLDWEWDCTIREVETLMWNPQVLYSLPAVQGHRLVLWQLQWTPQYSCEKGTVSRKREGEGGREKDVGKEEWEEEKWEEGEWNKWMRKGGEKEEKEGGGKERQGGGSDISLPLVLSLSSSSSLSQRKGDNLLLYL